MTDAQRHAATGESTSLFDGETLSGWHAVPRLDASIPRATERYELAASTCGRWTVQDGAIVGGQEIPGFGGYLLSDETFGDFELELEAKPDWPADTGILVRATARGYEGLQILIDHRKSGSIGGFYGNSVGGIHAAAFALDVRRDAAGRPVGLMLEDPATTVEPVTPEKRSLLRHAASVEEFLTAWRWDDWNRFRIRCVGTHPLLTVWVNDVRISEMDAASLPENAYRRDEVERVLSDRGHIALEVHDNDPLLGDERWGPGAVCRWRDIRVRTL